MPSCPAIGDDAAGRAAPPVPRAKMVAQTNWHHLQEIVFSIGPFAVHILHLPGSDTPHIDQRQRRTENTKRLGESISLCDCLKVKALLNKSSWSHDGRSSLLGSLRPTRSQTDDQSNEIE
jgi:hypothetical protein